MWEQAVQPIYTVSGPVLSAVLHLATRLNFLTSITYYYIMIP